MEDKTKTRINRQEKHYSYTALYTNKIQTLRYEVTNSLIWCNQTQYVFISVFCVCEWVCGGLDGVFEVVCVSSITLHWYNPKIKSKETCCQGNWMSTESITFTKQDDFNSRLQDFSSES